MRGYTLIELVVVLALAAFATTSLAPAARRYRDRAATIAAAPWRVWSEVGDSLIEVVGLESDLGVTVELSGGRMRSEIVYNALGLGRVASETLVFRRGDSAATLVVSSLGRVRRR